MKSAFDDIAGEYDLEFSNTALGKSLRNQVWKYLEKNVGFEKQIRVLEVNCGTGIDALYFAEKGCSVLATDISESMINVAQRKLKERSNPEFKILDINNLHTEVKEKFNLVFSDFGGLNCLSPEELKRFLHTLPQILQENGRFIAVIMPEFCLVESLFFLLKGKFKDIFRRSGGDVVKAWISDETSLSTWYYNPSKIKKLAPEKMVRMKVKGIGIALPPSFLGAKLENRKLLLEILERLEAWLSSLNLSARMADHYLVDITFEQ